jgi:hypothetical protein
MGTAISTATPATATKLAVFRTLAQILLRTAQPSLPIEERSRTISATGATQ